MKKHFRYYAIAIIAVFTILTQGCKKKEKDPYANEKGNYFSVRQFAIDEWNTHSGEPFTLTKTTRVNDNLVDSTTTTSDTLNWGKIFHLFFETDISDRSFLGQYKFNQFDDNADETHNFYYEANPEDDELFTRKLLLSINQYNQRVKGIYIEALKKTIMGETTYKLFYKPLNTIQIQTIEKPVLGSKKHTVVEYTFNR